MGEYVKKPKTFKAVQYDGNRREIEELIEDTDSVAYMDEQRPHICIYRKGYWTDEYLITGDWVVIYGKKQTKVKIMDDSEFNEKYAKVG